MEKESKLKIASWLKVALVIIVLLIIFIGIAFIILMGDPRPTKEYRNAESFVENHKGMTKREVIGKFGIPERVYYYTDGERHVFRPNDEEVFLESVYFDTGTSWSYDICKTVDPPYYYSLIIDFDSEGKTVSADMILIPGG